MKFYHESHGCSLAVDIVARELEIPLKIIWVDMSRKVLPDGTDLHKANPKGQDPWRVVLPFPTSEPRVLP